MNRQAATDVVSVSVGATPASPSSPRTQGDAGVAPTKRSQQWADFYHENGYLVVENDSNSENMKFRVYDLDSIKVSNPIVLDGSETSAEIASKITAALDPDNMLDPSTIMLVEKERSQRWYERWYVWVGIGAVVGGGILTYQYMSREPDTVKGF